MSSFNLPYTGGFDPEDDLAALGQQSRRNFSEVERRLTGVMKRYTPIVKSASLFPPYPTGYTSSGWYYTIGKTVWFQFVVSATATYNAGTVAELRVTLPPPGPASTGYPANMRIGSGNLYTPGFGHSWLGPYIPVGVFNTELQFTQTGNAILQTDTLIVNSEIYGQGFYEFA